MEHKLIQGGEQYLPFARSRIKALRATGLKYASQRFEVEGVWISVRIEDEQDYINIEGGEEIFPLDSGVVDLKATGGLLMNYPGSLHESDNVRDYNAPFVPYEDSTRWRKKRDGDDGQISGHVAWSGTKFRGKVPYDGADAECVTGRYVIEDESVTPPVWVVDGTDETVSAKKETIFWCPASTFTGKCRLYVQALYGRPLYVPTEKDHGRPTDIAVGFPLRHIGGSGDRPPSLLITPYRHDAKDPTEDVSEIAIMTSSGVYLDKATGVHWLMTVYATGVQCHKLIPSKAAARLRKYLTTANTVLDETDKEHLEAYILSTCLPSHRSVRDFDHGVRVGGSSALIYSTAYGWHWNWSGTAAVIVTTRDVYHGSTLAGNEIYKQNSSQFSMSVQFGEDGPTGVSTGTVQDDVSWMLSRRFWLVVVPSWGIGQRKLPPHYMDYSFVFSDVVYYAYYERDELITCSVTFETGTAEETVTGSSERMRSGAIWNGHTCVTSGSESGWVEDLGVGAYSRARFKIGDYETPNLYAALARQFQRLEVSNKAAGPWTAAIYVNPATSGWIDGTYYEEISTPTHQRSWQATTTYMEGTWDWTKTTGTRTDYGIGVAIIPFDDAQAVYMKHTVYNEKNQHKWVDHVRTVSSQTAYWGRVYVRQQDVYDTGSGWGPIIYGPETVREYEAGTYGQGGGWGGVPFITGSARVSESEVLEPYHITTDEDVAKLFYNAGSIDVVVNLGHVPSMFDVDMDYTATAWGSRTGVAQTGAVNIVDPQDGLPGGIQGAPAGLSNPAIVGWA